MAERLADGPPTVGVWLAMPEPLVVEAAAKADPDWVGLDLQHGAWDLASAFRAIQLLDALDVPVIVRLSELELHAIPRVLDHGAGGVVVAMASTELIEEAVRRCRYQPEGQRSYGGQRYGLRFEPPDVGDVRPHVYAMIGDRRGVESVSDIASVEGLAGLHVEPSDLALGLGVGPDRGDARFADALEDIVLAAHAAGLPATMHSVRPDDAEHWLSAGFDELVLTADIELLRSAFDRGVALARGDDAPPEAGPYGRR